jgi:hypothetical protein
MAACGKIGAPLKRLAQYTLREFAAVARLKCASAASKRPANNTVAIAAPAPRVGACRREVERLRNLR